MNKIIILFVLITCSTQAVFSINKEKRMVKIGVASNFSDVTSNSYNPFGNSVRNGINFAIEDMYKEFEKRNIQLALLEYDYGSNLIEVRKVVKQAVKDNVVAVVGYEYSDHALMAAPLHQKYHVPMLTPSASADRLGQMGEYIHQGTFNNSYQGEILATIALQKLKCKKVVSIVIANCAYCNDMNNAFSKEFKRKGGRIEKNYEVLEQENDFTYIARDIVKNIKNIDAIFIPNQELTSGHIIKTLLKNGITKPFLGGDGWRNLGADFFKNPYIKKFHGYMTAHWHSKLPTKESKEFVKRYQSKYRNTPTDSAVLAYDSMRILGKILLKAKTFSRLEIERELTRIKSFRGVSGLFLFQQNKAPLKTIIVFRSTQTGFIIDEILHPKKG